MSPDVDGMAPADASPLVEGTHAYRHDATPVPLLGVAVGLLALAGWLHVIGSTAGSSRLPLWVLFLGMGVIVLSGGVAAVLLGGDDPESEATDLDLVAPREPAAEPLGAAAPPATSPPMRVWDGPEPPEPPRPRATISGSLGTGPALDSRSPTLNRESAGGPTRAAGMGAALPVTAPAPAARDAREGIDASSAMGSPGGREAALACATCGRSLPSRDAWRRCRNCGRPLCTSCLTSSVRRLGSGYCDSCAKALS
ncbi:MAG: hypothetical protein L3K17_00755 [Thermoplasmata archaeon]|nr:hypothetical protein [Thermoplasmata archaeon]